MTTLGMLEELSSQECWDLLARLEVGRVAVGRAGRAPLVVPVNYTLDGEVIVFRTGPGTKLSGIRSGPASFQVDQVHPGRRTGWSVLVEGVAYEATAYEEALVGVRPWVEGDRSHWVRLVAHTVSGRRINLPDVPPDGRGYL